MTRLDRLIDGFIRYIRDSRIPDPIGGRFDGKNPTYWRYYVIPQNPIFNIYVHRFLKDDSQHMHTHRMFNITITLQGTYFEERFDYRPVEGLPLPGTHFELVKPRRPLLRWASTPHRVRLRRDSEGMILPMWSLFIGMPRFWNWGFWCPGDNAAHWKPQEEYLQSIDGGPASYSYDKPVKGCGD